MKRRTVDLTDDMILALDLIARQRGIVAKTGPRAGKPSWRALLKAIAAGEVETWKPDDLMDPHEVEMNMICGLIAIPDNPAFDVFRVQRLEILKGLGERLKKKGGKP